MNVKVDPCAGPGLWSIATAFGSIVAGSRVGGTENVPLARAAGRVTAAPIRSRIPLPRFDQSAMDGYGLHADDVAAGRAGPFPVIGAVRAGGAAAPRLGPGTAVRLLTGAAIPGGVAAVVMEERVAASGGAISLRARLALGDNIRRRGEDVVEGSEIVPAGTRLDARHLGVLAASGCAAVEVVRKVRVGILSTGDELADPGEALALHAVHDSNRPMLIALLAGGSGTVDDLGRVTDDLGRMAGFLAEVHADYDLIVTSGGVSGSDADHSVRAIDVAGGTSRRVALAVKPGKPFAFGAIGACRVVSLPGNPVAAMVGTLLFARPLLDRLSGLDARQPEGLAAIAASDVFHRPGRTEFVPAALVGRSAQGLPLVEKLGKGGSARLAPLVAADGLAVIPADIGDIPAGGPLVFHPFTTDFRL
ncbi:molybdopterin molybdotransferase MoeA [Methylobrevis albus]|uniref:Molybdopterin molybdenumtransferase n=1 Tax=Methylobrevis albus TaxID=2793297 RepID=A0A931HYP8_9HYPH|nr:gephyrin-like molybdotransferase Glp [Methylobrevis albus]MBH0236745.1 molybdopterin molybdotransferase MoeA [Methylobrevis albus]